MTNLVSDVYAATLYAACDGLPLWYPTVCEVGDVGFTRAGMFHKIFNAAEGPQSAPITFAATVSNALRTESDASSTSSLSSASDGAGVGPEEKTGRKSFDPFNRTLPKDNDSPRRPSIRSSISSSISRRFSGGQGAPLPLVIEEAGLKTFDMGPRMSSNYRSLGTTLSAHVSAAGVPIGATFTFESCGGDGALLVARDPVHRRALKHVGVLKAYLQQHREYIYKTYGEAEDFGLDELTMVFGQDSTSDWAVAVNIASNVGARVEFEVFSAVQAGVWGKWNSTCTASQRGPHRLSESLSQSIFPKDMAFGGQGAGVVPQGNGAGGKTEMTANIDIANPSISIQAKPASGTQADPDATMNADSFITYLPDWSWPKQTQTYPADQTIVVRRITAKSRVPFFPPKMQAAAGPRRDGHDNYRRQDSDQVLSFKGARERDRDPIDPLAMLHEYILMHTDDSVELSIATDDEALVIYKLALHLFRSASMLPMTRDALNLKQCLWIVAEQTVTICIDDHGCATVEFRECDLVKLQRAIFAAAPTQPNANDGVARRSKSFLRRDGNRRGSISSTPRKAQRA